MGLSKLLAASRSVRSITGQQARYKMTQQNLLPTFGAAKATETRTEETVSTAPETAPSPVPVNRAERSTAAGMTAPAKSESGSVKAAAFVEATKKLRPFGGGAWLRNPFARSAASECERRPVQTELSLDSVKPVRNDLSEPEVELGRDALRVDGPQAPRLVTTPPTTATVGPWQRLKTWLFGATDTN